MEAQTVSSGDATAPALPAGRYARPDRHWGLIFGAIAIAIPAIVAALPLDDNSFFTHLATGRSILESGQLPTVDPYTFTGAGQEWIAQSWLASIIYGVVEAIAGGTGLRLLNVGLVASLAALVWWLTSAVPAPTARVVVAAPVILLGVIRWTERPLLIGLLGLGLVLAALHGRVDPRLLVPLLWIWVNTHGSYPLAVALVGAALVGRALDREPLLPSLKIAGWVGVGILLGGLSPYGSRLWLFPLELASRSGILRDLVAEWQPIQLDEPSSLIFLVIVLVAALAASQERRWFEVLPALGFTVAALLSVRNTAPATLVLIPVMVRGLAGQEIGRLPALTARSARRAAGSLALAGGLVVVGLLAATPTFDWGTYPVASLDRAEAAGLTDAGVRLVTRDGVGNARGLREGPHQAVFIDDRFELHSEQLMRDYVRLINGVDWEAVLDRYESKAVLWELETPLATGIIDSGDWVTVESEPGWMLACRRGSGIEAACR